MNAVEVDPSEYEAADDDYMGWCTSCGAFTTPCCEPDAREYQCDDCGKSTVFGAEEALLMGYITIV